MLINRDDSLNVLGRFLVDQSLKRMGSILRTLNAFIRNIFSYFYNAFLFACISASCVIFIFPSVLSAHHVTLAWDPNIEPDLAGYIAYWGTSSGNYPYLTDVGNNTTHTITGLEEDRVYYFAITAYDSEYNESDYSDELTYAVTSPETYVSGSGGGGGGCFIATAAFGSPMAKHVLILRQFRDKILLPNTLGRIAILFYYEYSPPFADYIATHGNLRRFIRWSLLPIIGLCWVALKLGIWVALSASMLLLSFIVLIPLRSKEGKRYNLNLA
jgi:hypothetical protein